MLVIQSKSSRCLQAAILLHLLLAFVWARPGANTRVAQLNELAHEQQVNSSSKSAATVASQQDANSTSTSNNSSSNNNNISKRLQPPPPIPQNDEYLVGVGLADITGPAGDINLMGYAKPNQDSGGIHLRQYSRAIVIEDKLGAGLLYLSLDNGMVSSLLRRRVLDELASRFGAHRFNETNVMISATHTHSAPGGFFQYMLYNIPSLGFISQTLEALVGGIVRSVERAVASIEPSQLYYHEGELLDASINRSPTSYLENPASERARYAHNTDTTMHLLRVVGRNGRARAMLNWFAVHGTSMNNTNHLISSDNKGYAALLFEQEFRTNNNASSSTKSWLAPSDASSGFVAIFAQANEGDVSPNTAGPRCVDTGLPCDPDTSTCGNPPRNEKCIAFGPGKDMFESTKIIAHKQYQRARELFLDEQNQLKLSGPVRFIHEHIDMTSQQIPADSYAPDFGPSASQQSTPISTTDGVGGDGELDAGGPLTTCQAALGYSFAAGTTDGPGAFDFIQANTASTLYWNMVRNLLRHPSQAQQDCHQPKPILLSTGEMDFPYTWHPSIVPTQVFQVGQLLLVGLPGEFTTMSGRRVREQVKQSYLESHLAKLGHQARAPQLKVVLSGLSNIYTSYVATYEEYQKQRYEGASTLYGPHTLQAYVLQFGRLAAHLAHGEWPEINDGRPKLSPPDLTSSLFTLKPGVLFDGRPSGKQFGDVLGANGRPQQQQVHSRSAAIDKNNPNQEAADQSDNEQAAAGLHFNCEQTINVSFVAGHPRNDLRQEGSFLYIEKMDSSSSPSSNQNSTWRRVASDASWETRFYWERTNTITGGSKATVEWRPSEAPGGCTPGVYRVHHLGAYKTKQVHQYEGRSWPFAVLSENQTDADIDLLDRQLERALIERKRDEAIAAAAAHAISAARRPNERARKQDQLQQTGARDATNSQLLLLHQAIAPNATRSWWPSLGRIGAWLKAY